MDNCPVCNLNSEVNHHYYPREMMIGTRQSFEYLKCTECGCLYIKNIPDNLHVFYRDYYTLKKGFSEISPILTFCWRSRCNLTLLGSYPLISLIRDNSILEWLSNLNLTLKDAILDVGCGNGDVLYELSKNGFTFLY